MYEINKSENNAVDYENTLFVLKSMSTDKTRPFMCVVHVERSDVGSRLICTDGRRLHYADISVKIPEGNYVPVVTKDTIVLKESTNEGDFPNWKRVIPENCQDRGLINLGKTGFGKNVTNAALFSLAYSTVLQKTGAVINIRYLDDLLKTEWQVLSREEKNKALMFKRPIEEREIVAVIMPMMSAA